jgi:hypothetical protein
MKIRVLALLAMAVSAPALAQQSRTTAGTAVSSGFLVKAGTAIVAGINITSGATGGYMMLFDSATVPADGAVTPKKCVPVAANTGLDINWRASPLYFQQGLVVVFSTTGCFTKTSSATAFISGDIQ